MTSSRNSRDSNLETPKEINILLLGESGVGKSTLINAVGNYFAFSNILDAMHDENLLSLIPSAFQYTEQNGKEQQVVVGGVGVEVTGGQGQQLENHFATTECQIYEIKLQNCTIQFIDTPGIGGTIEFEKSESNLDLIFNFLPTVPKLNAIMVLLDANSTRLSPSLIYCLKRFLGQNLWQKNISGNILFMYTHARLVGFNGGDVTGLLKKLLDEIRSSKAPLDIPFEDNVFYTDSETFQFLAANHLMFPFPGSKEQFQMSWDKSRVELGRCLKRIQGMEPLELHISNVIRSRIEYEILTEHVYSEPKTVSVQDHSKVPVPAQDQSKVSAPVQDQPKESVPGQNQSKVHVPVQDRPKVSEEKTAGPQSVQKKETLPEKLAEGKKAQVAPNVRKPQDGLLNVEKDGPEPTEVKLRLKDLAKDDVEGPRVVCKAENCKKPQKCCGYAKPYGSYSVWKKVLFKPALWFWKKIDWHGNCKVCGCSYKLHKFIDDSVSIQRRSSSRLSLPARRRRSQQDSKKRRISV